MGPREHGRHRAGPGEARATTRPSTTSTACEAPLLLLGGALDPRCPPRQIAEVAEALRARGRVCDYVVYPDEGHEISGLEHRIDYDRRTVEFILEHTGSA